MDILEPRTLEDYPGQEQAKLLLKPAILAHKLGKPLDNMCLSGPPGLGKSSLVQVIAREIGGECYKIDSPSIKPNNFKRIIGLVSSLRDNDILFLDEIHSLDARVEEQLYDIVENRVIYIPIGPSSTPRRLDLRQFIVAGATTRAGDMSGPLRSRFGMWINLEFYQPDELAVIALRYVRFMGLQMTEDAAMELGRRARGTVRVLRNLFDRVYDVMWINQTRSLDKYLVSNVLDKLGIDENGLNAFDHKVLRIMKDVYGNKPVGINTLAASTAEDPATIEYVVEPFLLYKGLIGRTPKGRILTENGLKVA